LLENLGVTIVIPFIHLYRLRGLAVTNQQNAQSSQAVPTPEAQSSQALPPPGDGFITPLPPTPRKSSPGSEDSHALIIDVDPDMVQSEVTSTDFLALAEDNRQNSAGTVETKEAPVLDLTNEEDMFSDGDGDASENQASEHQASENAEDPPTPPTPPAKRMEKALAAGKGKGKGKGKAPVKPAAKAQKRTRKAPTSSESSDSSVEEVLVS
jgi:hypothetical protein